MNLTRRGEKGKGTWGREGSSGKRGDYGRLLVLYIGGYFVRREGVRLVKKEVWRGGGE